MAMRTPRDRPKEEPGPGSASLRRAARPERAPRPASGAPGTLPAPRQLSPVLTRRSSKTNGSHYESASGDAAGGPVIGSRAEPRATAPTRRFHGADEGVGCNRRDACSVSEPRAHCRVSGRALTSVRARRARWRARGAALLSSCSNVGRSAAGRLERRVRGGPRSERSRPRYGPCRAGDPRG